MLQASTTWTSPWTSWLSFVSASDQVLAPRARGPGIFLGLLLRHAAPTNRLPRKFQILFCPDSPALLIPSSPLKPPVCLPTIYSCRTLVFDLSPRRFDILTLIVDQAASDLTCRRRSLLPTQDKTTTESVSPTRVDRRVVRNVDEDTRSTPALLGELLSTLHP